MQLGICRSVLGCGTRELKILHCILCIVKVKLNWTLHIGRETGTEAFFFFFLIIFFKIILLWGCHGWTPMLVLVRLSGVEGPNEYSIMFSLLLVYTIILNLANHRISVHVRVELLVNYSDISYSNLAKYFIILMIAWGMKFIRLVQTVVMALICRFTLGNLNCIVWSLCKWKMVDWLWYYLCRIQKC